MIKLEPVHPGNWRLGQLRVTEAQKGFVAEPMTILARAYAYRESRSCALVITHDGLPVGMALYHDLEDEGAYDLSQLFIDERCQGRGYGTQAVRLLVERMREDGKYGRVMLCYIEGNEAARRMYEKLGFHLTGERDGDEIVMEKRLR